MAARSSTIERLRVACSDVHVVASSLDALERTVARVVPTAIVTWDIRAELALPVLARVRARDRRTYLVVVSATDDAEGRLAALAAGVDEALPPIGIDELAGRLLLAIRRLAGRRLARLPIANGTDLDLRRRELLRDGRWIHLRPKEARLLEVLVRAEGRTLTRTHILARVWGAGHQGDPRTVDVHVRWLRAKIEPDPRRPTRIITVRGVGYRLEASR
jgi:DNA-binding response OmpR family regulator